MLNYEKPKRVKKIASTGLVWLIAVTACAGSEKGHATGASQAEPRFATGIALTPKNFPDHNGADVDEMFELGAEAGDYAVFIYQWSQPDFLKVAKQMMERSKKAGLTPILGISQLSLAGARNEYDVPESVRRNAKGKLTFENDQVHLPFIKAALDLARLKPPYLCLATEINFLAFKDIKEYLVFAHVYKRIYPEIKKISPDTKVFVSFQWDFFHIMARDEPNRIREHSKLIEVFRPELDVVAFTSYPADHFPSVEAIPSDYYENVFNHVTRSEEIMFMEIGWPTTGEGSDESQVAFIERLPELMNDVNPSVIAWSLLHDVRLSGLNNELASTGLISSSGEKKPGWNAFVELARH